MGKSNKDNSSGLSDSDINKQIKKAMKMPEIKERLEAYSGTREDFELELRKYIERENEDNSRLIKLAGYLDKKNKFTAPIDLALDYFNIVPGVGYAANFLFDAAKAPLYLAYDAYYAGKTHDLGGLAKNLGYEAAAILPAGALVHLTDHYSDQATEYALEKGVERFLGRDKKRSKVVQSPEREKAGGLEGLAGAAYA